MRALERMWWRRDEPAWAEAFLWPLSLLSLGYRAGAALGRARARPVRAQAKVISVGNLGVGGAGKTPVVLELVRRLLARGRRPAVLSRGHGGSAREACTVVSAGRGPLVSAEIAGDEPVLIAERCPGVAVLVGRARAALAPRAIALGADVLVLDDGLQHRGLARALDVVVVDGENPLGNGRLLPRGPLREGPQALGRLQAPRGLLWIARADHARTGDPALAALVARAGAAFGRPPVESALVPLEGAALRGLRVHLAAGIARPERFLATVEAAGGQVQGVSWFADHHRFSAAELRAVRARAAGALAILVTEKDLVRIPAALRAGPPPIRSVAVALRVTGGEEALEAALAEALA